MEQILTQDVEYFYLNEDQVVDSPEQANKIIINYYDENGNLVGSETFFADDTIQEAQQMWNEEEHPRDEDGKFTDKGGTDNTSKQNPTYGQVPAGQKSAHEGGEEEPIELSQEPSAGHIETADKILALYQSQGKTADRNILIQQAHNADILRNIATNNVTSIAMTLNQNFPNGRGSFRVKKRYNMLEKLNRKPDKYKTLEDLTDVGGARLQFDSMWDAQASLPYVEALFDIVPDSKEDYTTSPNGGYRAVHYLVRNPDGTTSELQVRTKNQTKFGDWAHDFYKTPTEEMSGWVEPNRQQLTQYMEELGDYYYYLDVGMVAEPIPCPPLLIEHARCP